MRASAALCTRCRGGRRRRLQAGLRQWHTRSTRIAGCSVRGGVKAGASLTQLIDGCRGKGTLADGNVVLARCVSFSISVHIQLILRQS